MAFSNNYYYGFKDYVSVAQRRQQAVAPLLGCALEQAAYAPVPHLECGGFEVPQNKPEPGCGCPQGAVLIDGKSACGARFPIEAPRRHPGVERCLKGWDEDLKLLDSQAGEIQELCGARPQIGEP